MSERLTTSTWPLPPLDANLGYLFRLAHQRFRALLESELEHLGLSAQEYGILSVFETRPELSTSELARISQVTRQTMHTSVLSLEAAGLIERSARNQRVVLVRPTKRGRQCLEAATRRVRAVEHAALADLSREDERKIRLVFDNPAAGAVSPQAYENAVGLAASLGWHFAEGNTEVCFVSQDHAAGSDIGEFLAYLATIEPPESPSSSPSLLDTLEITDDYNIVLTSRPRETIPANLWACSYVIFIAAGNP